MEASTVAVVTGASRGLGLALAKQLLSSGASVVTIARSTSDELAQAATTHGARLQQLQADLSDPGAIENAAGMMSAALPPNADRFLLINNAGTVDPIVPAEKLFDAAAIERAFNLNVTALMVLTAGFLRSTPAKADRRILNISSGAGRKPTKGWGVYCATKAAVDHYTRVLGQEHPDARVAALAPGVVDTGMQERIRGTERQDFPELDRFLQLHEQGQLVDADTTAQRILNHLVSDAFGRELIDDIRNYV